MNLSLRSLVLCLMLLIFSSLTGHSKNDGKNSAGKIGIDKPAETVITEFRAVWIATINNIDWPSKPNLTVEQQKSEFLKLLDTFQQFNLNVVILQVRAASDAFYESKSEPWSLFLTGKQGKSPAPYYDPLAWAIEMCHQRGMELHAWFNPFRVRNLGYYPLDPKSFAAQHPQYVKEFDKKYFLDPGYPEVISHLVEVIAEVAHNYEVDAILMDDYFYPYPVEGKKFADEKSFAKYGKQFYPRDLKGWRRENINHFIELLHDTLRNINPGIKFGISPFGIWRNKVTDPEGSVGLKGMSSYDDLYADVRKWLKNGWIDYVIPQLYWEKGNHFGDFTAMVQWWSENSFGKPLYIGQALYKATTEKNGWSQPEEINNQINFLRSNDKVRGFAFYSASNIGKLSPEKVKSLVDNQLKSAAHIDDNRHAPVTTSPVANDTHQVAAGLLKRDEIIRKDFEEALNYNPISIRGKNWIVLPGKISIRKLDNGDRSINWEVQSDPENESFALVSLKKTGERKYRQTTVEISETATFKCSEQKWQELKKTELLLICRNRSKDSDRFSSFFQLKRRRVKSVENPFSHKN
jgi:uncharacterized lipoprotein YddW (UPF0748 family)